MIMQVEKNRLVTIAINKLIFKHTVLNSLIDLNTSL